MTASSTPRSSRPKPKPPTTEAPLVYEAVIAYDGEAKSGKSTIYKGVSKPGAPSDITVIYISARLAAEHGNPTRFKLTLEALPD